MVFTTMALFFSAKDISGFGAGSFLSLDGQVKVVFLCIHFVSQ